MFRYSCDITLIIFRYRQKSLQKNKEVEPELSDGVPLYNDLMSSYLMEVPERPEMFENVQRRSDAAEPVSLDKVLEANEKAGGTTPEPTTSGPSPSTTTQASNQQVQVTAVPASPEKKNVKSLVVPDTVPDSSEGSWRDEGQKEEPLFRPLQNSQRTVWSELDPSPLSRAKNTQNKVSSQRRHYLSLMAFAPVELEGKV
ncbi:hypothetical protein AVEN_219214-2 [Araneus ventricosus]|uniref:Uncharacterized protein n=1 Tax=Araneus ventricosus TaxID=182803 RepID=A0A4Y2WIL1_ARAVE|nr:hypothetical protein AVEN_219214-2 [Araneus ventricosus]